MRAQISLTHPSGECDDDISPEADALWFTMHHSDDPARDAVIVRCYLDDSGSDKGSPVVVIGGLVLDRDSFLRFDARWRKMLYIHRVESLHMKDFVSSNGKHIGMPVEMKLSLFREAVQIINARKTYSLSASLDNIHYKELFSTEFFPILGPYTVTFISAALVNARTAEGNKYPDQIAYLVDRGCPFSDQIDLGHRLISLRERATHGKEYTGSLTFANDEHNSALQAADVIAWSSRRKLLEDGLADEYEPLKAIFEKRFGATGISVRPHIHHDVDKGSMMRLLGVVSDKNGLAESLAELTEMARKAGLPK